jgi:hypothetical protein
MNYFLIVIILILSGGMYYMHLQDQQQIDSLQAQLVAAQKEPVAAPAPAAPASTVTRAPAPAPAAVAATINTVTKTHDLDSPPPVLNGAPAAPPAPAAPSNPAALAVLQPAIHSSAIDAAASAAEAASNSASIGNITTLDNHSYTNCKVLKVEEDGVTFTHDDGITKILYPMMPPSLQAKFGYTPQQAVAQTEAQIRAEQDQAAATNAPANP